MNGVPSEANAFLPWSSVSVTCGLMDSSFMDNGNLKTMKYLRLTDQSMTQWNMCLRNHCKPCQANIVNIANALIVYLIEIYQITIET